MWQAVLSFVLFVGMVACDGNAQPKAPAWPTASISVRDASQSAGLSVEIANTESRREQGLMYRQSLDDSHGMLFLFPGDVRDGFWMQNTYIPLDIAYIGADGRVLEIVHGKALDQTVLYPSQPYRYALEVADGWFVRHGLGVGSTLSLPADLPPAS